MAKTLESNLEKEVECLDIKSTESKLNTALEIMDKTPESNIYKPPESNIVKAALESVDKPQHLTLKKLLNLWKNPKDSSLDTALETVDKTPESNSENEFDLVDETPDYNLETPFKYVQSYTLASPTLTRLLSLWIKPQSLTFNKLLLGPWIKPQV